MIVFLGPAVVLLAYGLIAPAFLTTVGSFQNANGNDFVGFANYSWIFTTESNRTVLINTAMWIIIAPLFSRASASCSRCCSTACVESRSRSP